MYNTSTHRVFHGDVHDEIRLWMKEYVKILLSWFVINCWKTILKRIKREFSNLQEFTLVNRKITKIQLNNT